MLQRGAPKLGKDGKPMKDKHGKVIYEPYRIKFGLSQNLVLPEPEPPITSTFLFLAVFGSLGRLFMVRLSVFVRMTLFWNTGSM